MFFTGKPYIPPFEVTRTLTLSQPTATISITSLNTKMPTTLTVSQLGGDQITYDSATGIMNFDPGFSGQSVNSLINAIDSTDDYTATFLTGDLIDPVGLGTTGVVS